MVCGSKDITVFGGVFTVDEFWCHRSYKSIHYLGRYLVGR